MVESLSDKPSRRKDEPRLSIGKRLECLDHEATLPARHPAMEDGQFGYQRGEEDAKRLKVFTPLGEHDHLPAFAICLHYVLADPPVARFVLGEDPEYLLDVRFRRQSGDDEVAEPEFHAFRRRGGTCGREPDRATLHEDDRILAVAPDRRRGEPDHEAAFHPFQDSLEGDGGDVMAFIDDHLSVAVDQLLDVFAPGQALDDRDVDDTTGIALAATDHTDPGGRQFQECLKPFLPLPEQVGTMDEYKGVDAPPRYDGGRDDRLAEGGGCAEHARIPLEHRFHRLVLTRTHLSNEGRLDFRSANPLVADPGFDPVFGKEL